MNNLSFSELCCLFCCPPCPGKIASKLAFLPPDPTYTLMCDESGNLKTAGSIIQDWLHYKNPSMPGLKPSVSGQHIYACSRRVLLQEQNLIPAGFTGGLLACVLILESHYHCNTGTATSVYCLPPFFTSPAACLCLYGIRPENVIIYGQSIGTVPSVDLAARYESAAVILHSPLTSGMRVAFPDTKKTYCFDAFPNIDKISKITSPVLIIHGTEDEIIDFSHGLALFERCQRPVEPLWVEGAGHNDVELYGQYLERLKQFVTQEIVNL
ncbi:AB17B protein, partial [Nothoprocta ornata]|nr:AB17B protein [Nothoprocta ornata]